VLPKLAGVVEEESGPRHRDRSTDSGDRREDESRIREKQLRENFSWLNRFTLSLAMSAGSMIQSIFMP
jgi:hypothetical protein